MIQEREIIARAVWFLSKRERWSPARIKDYTGLRIRDIPQLVSEGWVAVLEDKRGTQQRQV